MERRIKPAVPAMAKRTERAEQTFSAVPRFLARRPVWRSQRSEAKERSRKMVVTQQPAMKRGLRPWAPMSDM